jgi:hypothetical protein
MSRQPLLTEYVGATGTLEAAGGTAFAPGSNLPGGRGASWCYVLPTLALARIVCLGAPPEETLTALARLGGEVVVCAPRRDLEGLQSAVRALARVCLLETSAAVQERSADLIFLARRPNKRTQREIERLLSAEGLLYAEYRSLGGPRRRSLRRLGRLGPTRRFWLGPAAGEPRVVAPLEDKHAVAYLERRFLAQRLLRRRLLRDPLRVLGRERLVNRVAQRRGVLVQRTPSSAPGGPPRYLQAIAEAAGVDITGRRWGVAAPGRFGSQKILMFLFEGTDAAPSGVAKITREARHNPRLENEWRALHLLREQAIGDDATVPRPLFFGIHATLAVLGETALDGAPFLSRTEATPACPYAQAAIEWLLDLGLRTAEGAPPGGRLTTGAFRALVDRFTTVYGVEGERRAFLARQAEALAEAGPSLPFVFQHGDPGPWNLIVTSDGRPGFLDWEAAEPRGMPLWDLFHFVRSFGFVVSKAVAQHDPLQSFAEQMLEDSALGRLLAEKTRRFCAETGLDASLVEPLFYLSWMHRALKEAARLREEQLGRGRYASLLLLAIERRDSPGLRRLFELPTPA